jgi:hypothetical protein
MINGPAGEPEAAEPLGELHGNSIVVGRVSVMSPSSQARRSSGEKSVSETQRSSVQGHWLRVRFRPQDGQLTGALIFSCPFAAPARTISQPAEIVATYAMVWAIVRCI